MALYMFECSIHNGILLPLSDKILMRHPSFSLGKFIIFNTSLYLADLYCWDKEVVRIVSQMVFESRILLLLDVKYIKCKYIKGYNI